MCLYRRRILLLLVLAYFGLLVAVFAFNVFRLGYRQDALVWLNHLQYEAEVLPNGDMLVTEKWDVRFSAGAEPHAMLQRLMAPVGKAEILNVTVRDTTADTQYAQTDTDTQAANSFWHFSTTEQGREKQGIAFRFRPIDKGSRSFELGYTLRNVTCAYQDIDFLDLVLWYTGLPVGRMDISIQLPGEGREEIPLPENNIEAATGLKLLSTLGGNDGLFPAAWLITTEYNRVELTGEGRIQAQLNSVAPGYGVGLSVVMPPGYIPQPLNRKPNMAAAPDLYFAISMGQELGQGLGQHMYKWPVEQIVLSLLVVAGTLLVALLYPRFIGRSKAWHKPSGPQRTIPKEVTDTVLSPGVASVLVNYYTPNRRATDHAVDAMILNLAHKGWLELSNGESGEMTISPGESGRQPPEPEEQSLLAYMQKVALQHGGSFTMRQYKSSAGSDRQAARQAVRESARVAWRIFKEKAYTKHWAPLTLAGVGMVAAPIIMLLLLTGSVELTFVELFYIMGTFVISGFLLLAVGETQKRLTVQGETELLEWKALKSYLEENLLLEVREPKEVALWDEYMIYGAMLGVTELSNQQIALRFGKQWPGAVQAAAQQEERKKKSPPNSD